MTINCKGRLIDLSSPKVMGILNSTPDSFFEDSRTQNKSDILKKAEMMLEEGATFIDIGGYSSRPDAENVAEKEELKRVVPAIELLVKEFPEILISVDTFRSKVAEEAISNPNMPIAIADKVREVTPKMQASFKLALKNEVNIAFGTDSGVSRHGLNANEFSLLVSNGMSEAQAIKSATVSAAKLLGQDTQLGDLSVGKQADIISVNASPLKNIAELENVQFVMKAGQIYKQ